MLEKVYLNNKFIAVNKELLEYREEISLKYRSYFLCPICNKILNKPITLVSCGHSFCMACLKSHLKVR